MSHSLLDVQNLRVSFPMDNEVVEAVRGVSFTLDAGECLAIVGESGSGKSVTARSLVGLAGDEAIVEADHMLVEGEDTSRYSEKQWRRLRGSGIGLVLQDALVSLDPLRKIKSEIGEAMRVHEKVPRAEMNERIVQLLTDVGVPQPENRARQYPHQLSGGLRQRALIASALAAKPGLLVADEPTTALDVTVQAQILKLLASMKQAGTAILLISHDLSVVASFADKIAVMHEGQFVEVGAARQVLEDPQDDYTKRLLKAIPTGKTKGTRLSPLPPAQFDVNWLAKRSKAESEEITVKEISKKFKAPDGGWIEAVKDVSFAISPGETLGIVGESGSGKSTIARMVMGMETPDSGDIHLQGEPWSTVSERERRPRRVLMQSIYQDPLSSFDPRWTAGKTLFEALELAGVSAQERRGSAIELLRQVGLPEQHLERRPQELSGGQRQRIAIARALALRPQILICDEPVSALDVSVQAQVLDLLADLQEQLKLTMLFISHDLGVIEHICDRVLVMKDGAVVESGVTDRVFYEPQHPYTVELLESLPSRALAKSKRDDASAAS